MHYHRVGASPEVDALVGVSGQGNAFGRSGEELDQLELSGGDVLELVD